MVFQIKPTASLDYATMKQRNTRCNAESPSQQKFLMTFMGVGGAGEIPDGWESSSDTADPYRGWDQGTW